MANMSEILLDDFAGKAMVIVLENAMQRAGDINGVHLHVLAKKSYEIAQAMMDERQRRINERIGK